MRDHELNSAECHYCFDMRREADDAEVILQSARNARSWQIHRSQGKTLFQSHSAKGPACYERLKPTKRSAA